LDSVIHLEDYLKILEKQGFKEVLKVPFVGRRWENLQWKAQDDLYLVYWRSPVIVAFDTFSMKCGQWWLCMVQLEAISKRSQVLYRNELLAQ
jgi:hypothetical protein